MLVLAVAPKSVLPFPPHGHFLSLPSSKDHDGGRGTMGGITLGSEFLIFVCFQMSHRTFPLFLPRCLIIIINLNIIIKLLIIMLYILNIN